MKTNIYSEPLLNRIELSIVFIINYMFPFLNDFPQIYKKIPILL